MAQRAADGHIVREMGIAKYTNAWEKAQQHVVEARNKHDIAAGLATLDSVAEGVRQLITHGTPALNTADVLVNMWRVAVNKNTRVHVFVFDYDRLNPKTGNALKLKRDQKYQPEDIKNIVSSAVIALLAHLHRPLSDHAHICSDGQELLFADASKFSVKDIMLINDLQQMVVLTGVDNWPAAYKPTVALAGADVLLLTDNLHQPLALTGDNGHGLRLTSLDVYTAAVMWQPGHRHHSIGNAKEGWMAYGNKLMYSWGNAISNNGWPLFSGDLQQKAWQQALPQNVARQLQLMRPDPIDEFAPDARRELAKGVAFQLLCSRNKQLYLRTDLWRPISFTGVSRLSPTDPSPRYSCPASLVEEYLHRMSSLFDPPNGRLYTWEKLFAGDMPPVDMQANMANQRFKSQLRRLPVFTAIQDKDQMSRRRIFKLHPQSADEHVFSYKGSDISVTEYYRMKYNLRLVHHKALPLVDVAVQPSKPTLLPMELCFIESHLCTAAQLLACKGKNEVPAEVTTAILRAAALPGDQRFGNSKSWTEAAKIASDSTSLAFGVSSDFKNDVHVNALLLDPNPAVYAHNTPMSVNIPKGGWMTPKQSNYLNPIAIGKDWFAVLHASLTKYWDTDIKMPFLREMAQLGGQQGITLEMCHDSHMIPYDDEHTLYKNLSDRLSAVGRHTVKIALVIMPSRNSKTYATIKQWGDVENGIPTQCVLFTTIKKAFNRSTGRVNPDTCYNLLLKMNVKMGGANWTFGKASYDELSTKVFDASQETLYLGVDVRHPMPARCTRHPLCAHHWHSPRNCPNMALARMSPYGSSGEDESPPLTNEEEALSHRRSPSPAKDAHRSAAPIMTTGSVAGNNLEKTFSFAAISGTIALDASRTGCTVRVQTSGREELVYVTDCLQERIREYVKHTKCQPKRIVYIRDGVADTQVSRMVQEEWPCLIDAIKAERLTSSPYVVFVMAQKTHNLRMFDPNGERGNVRMGTVLTSHSGVTAADCTDMYMVAHRALQGTAKPLRYVLVKHGWANPSIKDPPPFNLTEQWLAKELNPLHMMNARAQKSCMLPAPIKFAHLAAERASVHVSDKWGGGEDAEHIDKVVRVHTSTRDRMYWM